MLDLLDVFHYALASITDYAAFCAAVLVFLMIPGPGTFTVITSTAQVAMIAFVALALAARSGWTRLARQVAWLAGVVSALLLSSVAAPYVLRGAQGPIQIIQILLCSLWIAYLAWHLPQEQHD